MVLLFTSLLIPVALGSLLVALVWYIFFAFTRTSQVLQGISGFILILITTLFTFLGSWIWLYFNKPTDVGLFWHFILLFLILGGIAIASVSKNEVFYSPLMIIVFFVIIFDWGKLFIILPTGILVFALLFFVDEGSSGWTPNLTIPTLAVAFIILLISTIGVNLMLYAPIDNAQYYDSIIEYEEDGLPFSNKVTGPELRVVDEPLASSIMKKSNRLGSNTKVSEIHLGHINGSTYWIGGVSFDGNKFLRQDLNFYQGFIAVDFRNPEKPPIIIEQEFYIGKDLVLDRQLQRNVFEYNNNFKVADNTHFTMTTEGEMRLMVPYSVQADTFFEPGIAGSTFITQEIQKLGGVLEFAADGSIIADYTDPHDLPVHGQVQYYSEVWLEREINYWGQSITQITPERDFGLLTHLGGIFKSQWRMGMENDTRVIIDPDTGKNIQFALLESKGSDNQVLRGAMKANSTGIYFYDWSEYGFIDSDAAKAFAETTITSYLDTITHGYSPLLPILYPIVDNPSTLFDYAYIIPLQFKGIRFGGVVIVDPDNKAGTHSVIKIVENEDNYNISRLVGEAIEEYLLTDDDGIIGSLEVNNIYQYVEDGNTVLVMTGNFTFELNNRTELVNIVFRADKMRELQDWLLALDSNVGVIYSLNIQLEAGIYYAVDILN